MDSNSEIIEGVSTTLGIVDLPPHEELLPGTLEHLPWEVQPDGQPDDQSGEKSIQSIPHARPK